MQLYLHITPEEIKILTSFLEKEIDMAQSQWLTQVLAAIATIAQGNAGDPALQAKVTALAAQLGTDEGNAAASNAEFQTAISALVKQLAASPPPVGVAPVVTTIAPTTGAIAGNETFTITGTGFTGATVVHFGSVAGTNLTVASDTSITVTSPAQAAGTVDVTVTTPGGVSATIPADQIVLS